MVQIVDSIEHSLDKISSLGEFPKAVVIIASGGGLVIFLYYACYLAFRLSQVFRLYILSQYCLSTNFVKKYGQWAVVSGGGDGIGRAMARELARRGMSIIVIDWDAQKLATTRAILEREANVGQVETIQADLSDSSIENFDNIRSLIKPDRDIGVLINNVGMLHRKMGKFTQFEMEELTTMVNLNAMCMLHLTRMIMPGMIRRTRGLVLNAASHAALVPMPYMSLYGPTKSFVASFTRQLQMEYSSHPIDIVLLTPGPVLTGLADPTKQMSTSFLIPDPAVFAKSAINALSARVHTYSGLMRHGLVAVMLGPLDSLGLQPLLCKLAMRRRNTLMAEGCTSKMVQIESQKLNPKDHGVHIVQFGPSLKLNDERSPA